MLSLQAQLNNIHTYQAQFVQRTITASARVMNNKSTGLVYWKKPHQFLWQFDTPFKQSIYVNGRQVVHYNQALKQALVQTLTPAQLKMALFRVLNGGVQVSSLYQVKHHLIAKGWVTYKLRAKVKASPFQWLRITFMHGLLTELHYKNAVGQEVDEHFSKIIQNKPIADSRFEFTAPKGVDVLRQERKSA